jgi:hypothetical protein
MDETKLAQIWNAIESLAAVLGSISERLDRAEGRADALGVRGSDPIGEERGERPVH